MKKVYIVNIVDGRKFGASFEDENEMNQWIEKHKSKKTWGDDSEIEISIEDITLQYNQEKLNRESLKYLADTDWYVIRKQETGKEIPQEILDARSIARNSIIK